MRLLLLNPNTSQSVTDLIAQAAKAAAAADTELEAVTAHRGVPYIATRAEAVIGAMVVLDILAERHGDFDAAIVAAFGDPGLGGARELFALPVIGLAEAGMLTACMLGRRFAIVTFSPVLVPWYEESVAWHGMGERCAGVVSPKEPAHSVAAVQEERQDQLVALAERAVLDAGADVIVLAGAPLAGLAARVRDRIPVPTVDCVAAAVKLAEAVVTLAPAKAAAGTYRRPDAKESTGLSPRLADWLAHRPPS